MAKRQPKHTPPPLMPREERLRLLHAPLSFHIIQPKSWGGTIINHGEGLDIPVEGHRSRPSSTFEDGWENTVSGYLEDLS